ncbi:hypothetical protein DRW48_10540 [Paracoccus suum]|uniref:Uncharacterized protein n=1 Tax=Paracoccus suum TaxID=2259340 RepID=A0A344PL17_9RHOB|nr:phage tail protein [Paracoccus suum]AXC50072.1 hypothetical protein DRW48_10540 [Paracoccus suum]
MPQVVGTWIINAAVASGALASATGIGAALISAGAALAFNAAIAKIFAPKGPKPKDLQNELRQSDAPRVRYLGTNRASGAVLFWDWRSVGSKRVLFKLIAIAQGGMTDVRRWWLNDVEVTVVSEGVTGGIGDRVPDYGGNVNLRWRSGKGSFIDGGQYPSLLSAVTEWTAAHKATRVGTILAEFKSVSSEDAIEVYPGGEPKVLVEFDGDIANAPGRTPTHTLNLAWQLYDIITHADHGWLAPSEMDDASWALAVSDSFQTVPSAGGTTRARYLGGGGYQLAEPLKDVAQRWLDGMDGHLFLTTDGKLGMRVGKWRPPTYTITEDKIVSWDGGSGRDGLDVVATLVPKFTSPENMYQETSADPWEDPVALARYGEVAPKEIDLPVVQHHGQARRIAKRRAAAMNPKWRFTINLRFWGLLLYEEENVYLHMPRIGINNQPFAIRRWQCDMNGGDQVVTVTLEHVRPEADDWTAAEEGTAPVAAKATPGPKVVPTISIISTTVVTGLGSPYVRTTFTQPAGESVIGQYRRAGSVDPWTEMIREGTAGGVMRTQALFDREPIDMRFGVRRASWGTAIVGTWTEVNNIEVVANGTPPAPPTVVSWSGGIGTAVSVTFRPDLGANYSRTSLYRGEPDSAFASAAQIATTYATGAEVTIGGGTVPTGGAKYWLRSENASNVASAEVLVANIS